MVRKRLPRPTDRELAIGDEFRSKMLVLRLRNTKDANGAGLCWGIQAKRLGGTRYGFMQLGGCDRSPPKPDVTFASVSSRQLERVCSQLR